MTAMLGHLMEVELDPIYKKWNTATTSALFDAAITKDVRSDMKSLADNLKKEARNAQMLVIWTDCDREGENIGAEVAMVCRQVNPRIIVKRARFSVVQNREIKYAWRNLVLYLFIQGRTEYECCDGC